MKKKSATYDALKHELTIILDDAQEGNIPLDQLEKQLTRANEIIKICEQMLRGLGKLE